MAERTAVAKQDRLTLPQRVFYSHGLFVHLGYTAIGERGMDIQGKVLSGRIIFIPNGISDIWRFKPDRLSKSMLKGIQGLQAFFDVVDAGRYPEPALLYGDTNQRMADAAAAHLGFKTLQIQAPLTPNGKPQYLIGAKTSDVREKLLELTQPREKRASVLDIMQRRVDAQSHPLFRRARRRHVRR